LQQARLAARFRFDRDGCANCVGIAFFAGKAKGDRCTKVGITF
jgi:hypothetical protein